jgi:hypothetical protein
LRNVPRSPPCVHVHQHSRRTPTTTSDPLAHGRVEDIFGLLSGTFVASLGIYLLHSAHAVTGGTAGLSLLISYATGWSFSVVYPLSNLPFLVLALAPQGVGFTLRTLLCIVLVSAFALIHPLAMPMLRLNTPYAVLVGNLLAGVGCSSCSATGRASAASTPSRCSRRSGSGGAPATYSSRSTERSSSCRSPSWARRSWHCPPPAPSCSASCWPSTTVPGRYLGH